MYIASGIYKLQVFVSLCFSLSNRKQKISKYPGIQNLHAAPTPTMTDAIYNVDTYGYIIEPMNALEHKYTKIVGKRHKLQHC